MTYNSPSPIRLIAVTLLGALIGFLTVILLPFLFIFWLTYWLPHERDVLLSAARCDGGEEDTTPLVDAIRRDMFIADLEKRLEGKANIPESILPESIKPPLDEDPLPPAFQRWIDGRQNK
jgi:hypothetical protein